MHELKVALSVEEKSVNGNGIWAYPHELYLGAQVALSFGACCARVICVHV